MGVAAVDALPLSADDDDASAVDSHSTADYERDCTTDAVSDWHLRKARGLAMSQPSPATAQRAVASSTAASAINTTSSSTRNSAATTQQQQGSGRVSQSHPDPSRPQTVAAAARPRPSVPAKAQQAQASTLESRKQPQPRPGLVTLVEEGEEEEEEEVQVAVATQAGDHGSDVKEEEQEDEEAAVDEKGRDRHREGEDEQEEDEDETTDVDAEEQEEEREEAAEARRPDVPAASRSALMGRLPTLAQQAKAKPEATIRQPPSPRFIAAAASERGRERDTASGKRKQRSESGAAEQEEQRRQLERKEMGEEGERGAESRPAVGPTPRPRAERALPSARGERKEQPLSRPPPQAGGATSSAALRRSGPAAGQPCLSKSERLVLEFAADADKRLHIIQTRYGLCLDIPSSDGQPDTTRAQQPAQDVRKTKQAEEAGKGREEKDARVEGTKRGRRSSHGSAASTPTPRIRASASASRRSAVPRTASASRPARRPLSQPPPPPAARAATATRTSGVAAVPVSLFAAGDAAARREAAQAKIRKIAAELAKKDEPKRLAERAAVMARAEQWQAQRLRLELQREQRQQRKQQQKKRGLPDEEKQGGDEEEQPGSQRRKRVKQLLNHTPARSTLRTPLPSLTVPVTAYERRQAASVAAAAAVRAASGARATAGPAKRTRQ